MCAYTFSKYFYQWTPHGSFAAHNYATTRIGLQNVCFGFSYNVWSYLRSVFVAVSRRFN